MEQQVHQPLPTLAALKTPTKWNSSQNLLYLVTNNSSGSKGIPPIVLKICAACHSFDSCNLNISKYLDTNKLICDRWHLFRQSRSTVDLLTFVCNSWNESKAFDRVWYADFSIYWLLTAKSAVLTSGLPSKLHYLQRYLLTTKFIY